jgi:hypothetical protein
VGGDAARAILTCCDTEYGDRREYGTGIRGIRGQTGRSPFFQNLEIGVSPVCPQFLHPVSPVSPSTTDGHKGYLEAVENAFGADIDYAMLQKIYGASADSETRYSPATCIGCDMKVVSGNPDPKHVSTSYVERQNLTLRTQSRRFTRLTNAFSKKIDNHRHSIALHYMFYNFCRVHQTLRCTPAMEAGLTDHVWTLEELIALLPKPMVKASVIEKNLVAKALAWPS